MLFNSTIIQLKRYRIFDWGIC